MKKGFSLIEVMISLAIGAVVLSGLVLVAIRGTQDFESMRRRVETTSNLDMVREELWLRIRGLEPAFWERFPMRENVLDLHTMAHTHGAVQFGLECTEGSDCMTLWDIKPPVDEPVVYKIDKWVSPDRFGLIPVDFSVPAGLPKSLQPMSVLLFFDKSTQFCRLVAAIEGEEVVLAPLKSQPWSSGGHFNPNTMEVVYLGQLDVTHCSLIPESGRGHKMVYQPWTLSENEWVPRRRYSSYTHLHSLAWTECSEREPDRMAVFARPEKAQVLEWQITIAGRPFSKEVYCASISF